ncbi:glycerol-3-phosphate 1-O-acyltransferase [Lacihabitans sp. LS3-19]|uniref:glycerol-3-phosphate 1-O-acyltransferase PlsY n=1 Tax=Lacihabitans sp. LS3-19 TaxID=2487335 RepID=UPI0020CED708|nr:glycerol-3-phosphate 1-O-acyltransferase PlsY [Lacihabitans sp. LS3-19]MCP9769131.1 glycerol-3-phosphate 1-O-acyltransferase [Lacihabitans sp. LS3-19]
MFLKISLFLFAYLLGSIPTAYWYAKFFHGIDIRQHGSGNIGATNSLRVLGKKAGIIVLIFDLLKGLIPAYLARFLGLSEDLVFLIGITSILGHIFSVFAGFKGGKGIATSLGVILAVSPIGGGVSVLVFITVVYITKYVSLGSLLAGLAFVVYFLISNGVLNSLSYIAIGLLLLIVFTHRVNIQKLMHGNENKLGKKV